MSELKRCPFCGGESKLMTMSYEVLEPVVWDEGFGNDVDTWVHCYGCDTDFCHSDITNIPVNIEDWWNTRTPVDKVMERLEEAIKERILTAYNTSDVFVDGQANGLEWAIEIIKEGLE